MKYKTAIIIGATSGIGRAVARKLVLGGCSVGVTGRRAELLDELSAEFPALIHTAAFDVAAKDVAKCLDALAASLSGVDLVLFCSGTGDLNYPLDEAVELATNEVNVQGFTRVADWAYHYFVAHNGGHFAAITSVMGLRGSGTAPAYAASKAYQINYLQGLQQRAAHEEVTIRITDLRPGSVQTAMMKGEGHFWISTPETAADCILRALESNRRVQYVTPRWKTIGCVLYNMPGWLHRKM